MSYRCVLAVLLVLGLGACSSPADPYQAWLACNQQIKWAENDRQLLSCFTRERRDAILARHAQHTPEIWRNQFRTWRPDDTQLFRAVQIDGDDTVNLLMYSGDGVYLTRHTAELHRESGGWHIGAENSLSFHPGFDNRPDAPTAVSMDFSGAVEWRGDALIVSSPGRRGCNLQIRHIYDLAYMNVEADCRKLRAPGSYTVEEIIDPANNKPIYVQAPGGGRLDSVNAGEFVVEALNDGRMSARFKFNVAGMDGPYTVSGTFRNVPVPTAEITPPEQTP